MIKHHIMSLLFLAAAAFSGIESAAVFYETHLKKLPWYQSGKAWFMAVVFVACIVMYFRSRSMRKKAVMNSQHKA
jgi:hypothetical protein